ncbi:cobalamin binding intrinsic factor-like [Daphnia pulex]|uniref:cobalamin binding intrinsic factor-like n=1 Tax=Daphnia pulex TaxID=6669 RepID=UPI001EDFBE4A|nr:cobalamin binding intrinsic factor-like [Daphnia pulex]
MMFRFNIVSILVLLTGIRLGRCQVALSDTNQARSKATEWLLKEWIEPRPGAPTRLTGGWDDSNTIRVLTALQLVDNGWLFNPANKEKAELAVRQMNSEILNGLVKSVNMTFLSAEESSHYVNGLLATCQNPENFYGHNLVAMLTRRMNSIPSGSGTKNVGQVIASVLALCNAGAPIPPAAIQRINSELKPTSGSCSFCVEGSSMAILAMKCLRDRPGPVDQLVQGISTRQIAYVKGKQDKDGGFDDLISTSLAVQAANAVGTVNLPINVAAALNYILQDQDKETGSFGNPAFTSVVLPTLIGRSALDVRNINCPAPRPAGNPIRSGQIRTLLSIEDTVFAQTIVETKVDTNPGQTILQIMNEQSAKHPRAFKFTTEAANGGTQLTGLNSVTNDSKNNWSWRVFRIPPGSNQAPQPVSTLDNGLGTNVQNGDKIIFRFG